MLRRSLKDFQPMSPTMPFSMSPDQPALHRPSLSHFRGVQDWRGAALQLGSRESVRQPSQHPQARWAAFFFRARLVVTKTRTGRCVSWHPSRWDVRRSYNMFSSMTTTTPSPMMRSMPPSSLGFTPTVSAASHGDPPLTQAEELTKVSYPTQRPCP
ncbi:hypothetical protein EDB89DRAFT_2013891 [Lactarius sanguifluus]|nr:hypothetical protein EDB89DRAFT_2013891 [Lactarius sanguifluus]